MLVLVANGIACPTCAGFAHILGAFPLVFPEDGAGRARKAGLLAGDDELAGLRQ